MPEHIVVIGKPYHDWKDAAIRAELKGLRDEVHDLHDIAGIWTEDERRGAAMCIAHILNIINARLAKLS